MLGSEAGPVFTHIPIIDVSPLIAGDTAIRRVASEIGCACRESGFSEGRLTQPTESVSRGAGVQPRASSAVCELSTNFVGTPDIFAPRGVI
jgi:hypothetical protein